MAQYELSIDPALVAEAEKLLTLEGRAFPTVVVQWESQILGQTWLTTLVQEYTIPLPPLRPGLTFNDVRIAAYTSEVPTKFLYLGTELGGSAPRIGPEMENTISPPAVYQEYKLEERNCAVPYLELIASTPRIYGNGPQDYYSPPIRVERFDVQVDVNIISDNFPTLVANPECISGPILVDPSMGFWQGARFVGTRKIAILRHSKVVGLYHREGDKEIVPPEVVRRDPKMDVRDVWVAVDIGSTSCVAIIGNGEEREFVRIGATTQPRLPADFENPTEICFNNLHRVLRAWRDRVILPLTAWGDLWVGHAAREARTIHGKERALRTKASVCELALLADRMEKGAKIYIAGRSDLDSPLPLDLPAPPVLDEEGIDPDDPFDPLELYAYYLGLHVNTRQRGLHLRYAIGMPTGWPENRRTQVLAAFRRGILRSLPAGMVAFDDLNQLQVVDAGPNVLSFAAFAFRVFGIVPRGEPIPYVAVDAGASETSVMCGTYRDGTVEEVGAGMRRVLEHVEPVVLPEAGAERLLHRMAYKVYAASLTSMRNNEVVFEPPQNEVLLPEPLLRSSPDSQANVRLLKDAIRSILENPMPQPLPDVVQLFSADGRVRDVRIMVDRAALGEWLRSQLSDVAVALKEAIGRSFGLISREEPPWGTMRVLLGGRLGMHPFLQERLQAVLPQGVRVHRFKEPDETNLAAPTVKLASALGILTLRYEQMAPTAVCDQRTAFSYVVGRSRRGKLLPVIDATVGYDVWRELGPCTKPDTSVLYAEVGAAAAGMEVDETDPRVRVVQCMLGYDAVGYRVYVRAVHGTRLEVSFGPPGGRPDEDAPVWGIDLAHGTVQPPS